MGVEFKGKGDRTAAVHNEVVEEKWGKLRQGNGRDEAASGPARAFRQDQWKRKVSGKKKEIARG